MKVGVFDSGMGGLTVLKEALDQLPQLDYVYYADSNYAPYGTQSKEEVLEHCHRVVQFLLEQKVDVIVVACNTATSIAIESLRKTYFIPIIGIEPAVKPAIEQAKKVKGRVLVTATPLTIKNPKLKQLIQTHHGEPWCDLLALPKLVEWAETMDFSEEEVEAYLEEELRPFNPTAYTHVVLGCTHFPLFKSSFKKVMGESVQLMDGGKGVVRQLANHLSFETQRVKRIGEYVFYRDEERLTENDLLSYFERLMESVD